MSSQNHHIARAIDLLGSQAALADRIDRSQQAVSNMLAGAPVSGEVAVAVEAATLGAVTRHDLRPDLFAGPPPMSATGRRRVHVCRVEVGPGWAEVELSDGSLLAGIESLRLGELAGSLAFFKVDLTLISPLAHDKNSEDAA